MDDPTTLGLALAAGYALVKVLGRVVGMLEKKLQNGNHKPDSAEAHRARVIANQNEIVKGLGGLGTTMSGLQKSIESMGQANHYEHKEIQRSLDRIEKEETKP